MSEHQSVYQIRLDKLARLREIGLDPYAVEKYIRTHTAQELLDQFETLATAKEGEKPETEIRFAGRIVSYRQMGKAGFAHVSDGDSKIQAYFRKDDLTEAEWEAYTLLDLGDHVGVTGYLFLTKTGERSIHVTSFLPLSKSLQTLPLGKEKDGEKFSELTDVELRYRHRHLDLMSHPEVRKSLLDRARITSSVRRFFDRRGFLEFETPVLQLEAGGAAARTFNTHYNAYELDVKLRISLELYLKRIICGDVPKVYEVGRVFRNEGVSNRHSPEFTMVEWYEAYANLEDMMVTVEDLFREVSQEVFGTSQVTVDGVMLDFSKPWQRVDLCSAIAEEAKVPVAAITDLAELKKALGGGVIVNPRNNKRIDLNKEDNLGGLIEKLLEVYVEDLLVQPSFVIGYPVETSPLAKHDPNRPGFTRRFEGYARGREVCNAFSEINDPTDQRSRFEMQMKQRAAGDDEAHPMDEEFLYALECGMPPTGGCGIGIERMAMLLTGAEHIREITMFPTMKPE